MGEADGESLSAKPAKKSERLLPEFTNGGLRAIFQLGRHTEKHTDIKKA
jgi:hypothetical protein